MRARGDCNLVVEVYVRSLARLQVHLLRLSLNSVVLKVSEDLVQLNRVENVVLDSSLQFGHFNSDVNLLSSGRLRNLVQLLLLVVHIVHLLEHVLLLLSSKLLVEDFDVAEVRCLFAQIGGEDLAVFLLLDEHVADRGLILLLSHGLWVVTGHVELGSTHGTPKRSRNASLSELGLELLADFTRSHGRLAHHRGIVSNSRETLESRASSMAWSGASQAATGLSA